MVTKRKNRPLCSFDEQEESAEVLITYRPDDTDNLFCFWLFFFDGLKFVV
jgi:hypothetical protein